MARPWREDVALAVVCAIEMAARRRAADLRLFNLSVLATDHFRCQRLRVL